MRLTQRLVLAAMVAAAIAAPACGGSTTNASADAGPDGASASDGTGGDSSGSSSGGSGSSSGASSSSSGSGSSSGASSSSSSGGGRVPVNHRPSDAQCQTMPAAGDCSGSLPDSSPACVTDSQCTSGKNGRCVEGGGGIAHDCSCTYDACTHDADCGAGETCACHGSTYTGDSGNRCVTGDCRVDSDCGAGGYCSPSSTLAMCGGFSVAGYYCHTAADTCTDDADCSSTAPAGWLLLDERGPLGMCERAASLLVSAPSPSLRWRPVRHEDAHTRRNAHEAEVTGLI